MPNFYDFVRGARTRASRVETRLDTFLVGKPSAVMSDGAARESACATPEVKQLFLDRL